MPGPELSERLSQGRVFWPLIRRTGCPEANSNVKREMGIFGDRGDPLQKQILPQSPLPFLFLRP